MADPTQSPTPGVDMSGIASALLSPNYINPAYATPEQRAQLYAYANELMKPQPINNGWQGLASIARALVGGYEGHLGDVSEQASRANTQAETTPTGGYQSSGGAMPTAPMAPTSAAPATGGAGTIEASDPGPIAPQAAGYLMQNGVTNPLGAAAMAGNFAAESGFNPQATRPGDGHDGSAAINIGQWNGTRAQAFNQFATANKLNPSDPKTGLAFATQELHTTEAPALAALNAATTPEQANAAALSYFRPAGYTAKDPTQSNNYGTRLAYTNATAAKMAMAARAAQQPTQVAGPGGVTGRPAYAPGQLGAMAADPNLPPEMRGTAMGLTQPHMEQTATGQTIPTYQGAAAGQPVANLGVLRDQTPGSVPAVVSGSPTAPQNTIAPPAVSGAAGPPSAAAAFGPNSTLGQMSQAQAATNAQNANIATKQKAATDRFQAAQQAGPQLMAAAYPLRQLQQIIGANGGSLPSGEGSAQLMKGLSLTNMLGTFLGHPIATEDSTLPTLELLKKYGMQAAQAQAQALGLNTNLGLESSEITSNNPTMSGPANAHLVDNLVRLNQVAQKKVQFDHDLFLQNGQRPDAYDNATAAWQQATSGANAIPLASARFGHQYMNAKGEKRVIVPSTDPSGFSVYSPDDPAVADIGPRAQ